MALATSFYVEVTHARRDADHELQENLASARQELVDTYRMSEQLIGNIESLLVLNDRIDADVEATKRKAQEELGKPS